MKTRDIVFVHGMFMTPLCWENWVDYYQSKGYRCHAPAWPDRDAPISEQRRNHPDPALGRMGLSDVVSCMESAVQALGVKPVLVGHSMGGLVVQLLLQKDLAVAGVAIDPAPPQGVFSTAWSFLKANYPAIDPLKPASQPVRMSFEHFQYAFVNTLPRAEQLAAYDRYVVPESRRVPRQSLTSVAHIDFSRPHAPLLITAGQKDHIIPASLNAANYRRYKDPASITAFKQFPGRDHFVIGEPGWQEVADFVLSWLEENVNA
jgi:pimeloyl-ACP methyl ester carboxylesterase